jgi:hypothetical protein
LNFLLALALVLIGDGERWQVDLPDGWETAAIPATQQGAILATYERTGGWRLVVARLRGNTDAAYDGDQTFFSGLEDGVRQDADGYRRLAAKQRTFGKKNKIPVYDLWYRTTSGVRGSRFFLMKGYVVVGTIEVPRARKVDAAARRILESMAPAW